MSDNSEQFEVSIQSIIDDLMSENRRLALDASTLRAAISDIRKQSDAISKMINGTGQIQENTEEQNE